MSYRRSGDWGYILSLSTAGVSSGTGLWWRLMCWVERGNSAEVVTVPWHARDR